MSGPNYISQWEQTFTDQSFLIYTGTVVSHTCGCKSNALASVCFHCSFFSGVLLSLFLQRRFCAVYSAMLGKCTVSAWQQLRGWGLCVSGVASMKYITSCQRTLHHIAHVCSVLRMQSSRTQKMTRRNNCTDNQNTITLQQLDTPVTYHIT